MATVEVTEIRRACRDQLAGRWPGEALRSSGIRVQLPDPASSAALTARRISAITGALS